MWHSTPSCRFMFLLLCLPVFVAKSILKTHQHFCFHSHRHFRFSRFAVPSRQRNHRKSFYYHGKYFAKKTFVHRPAWTSAKFYCGNKTGNPERAVLLHLARSGSQSQRGIWSILPAHGASHIITCLICRLVRSLISADRLTTMENIVAPKTD